MTWEDLEFWRSPSWELIQKRLDDLDERGIQYCPSRENIFKALDITPLEKVRVAIFGQDPYPNPSNAMGLAYSVPPSALTIPDSLNNIFRELQEDLHLQMSPTGSLNKWAQQGVLLWNVIPTCEAWKSMSHSGWAWQELTSEIVTTINDRCIVAVFPGRVAQGWSHYLDERTEVIEVSHPSPRSFHLSFQGSRIFSRINDKLVEQGQTPIDWRL